jgi:hypothetical protein
MSWLTYVPLGIVLGTAGGWVIALATGELPIWLLIGALVGLAGALFLASRAQPAVEPL